MPGATSLRHAFSQFQCIIFAIHAFNPRSWKQTLTEHWCKSINAACDGVFFMANTRSDVGNNRQQTTHRTLKPWHWLICHQLTIDLYHMWWSIDTNVHFIIRIDPMKRWTRWNRSKNRGTVNIPTIHYGCETVRISSILSLLEVLRTPDTCEVLFGFWNVFQSVWHSCNSTK